MSQRHPKGISYCWTVTGRFILASIGHTRREYTPVDTTCYSKSRERVFRLARHYSPVISGASGTTRSHWLESSQLRFCAALSPAFVPHQPVDSGGLDRDRVLGRLPRVPPAITGSPNVGREKKSKRERKRKKEKMNDINGRRFRSTVDLAKCEERVVEFSSVTFRNGRRLLISHDS